MWLKAGICAGTLAAAAVISGCAMAQTIPSQLPPFGKIEREEKGEVVSVHDTRIDLSTGTGRSVTAHAPAIPVGPIGVRVPVTLGGEKKVKIPGEEITVKLASGKLILVVQELSSPPFAPGERVRVLYEEPEDLHGVSRTRVEREY
jgi:hypothetical protein